MNGLGARAIKLGAVALAGGEIAVGHVVVLHNDGVAFQLVSGGGGRLPIIDGVSPISFGAKCDGSTDDHVAVQAAYAVAGATGAKLVLPSGTCSMGSTTLKIINNNVHVSGAGWGTSILTSTANPGIQVGTPYTVIGDANSHTVKYTMLDNFSLTYNGTPPAGGLTSTATGTGSGTNLTLSGVTGTVKPGDAVTGTGVPANTVLVSQTSGTLHGAGVYVTNNATTSSGAAITLTSKRGWNCGSVGIDWANYNYATDVNVEVSNYDCPVRDSFNDYDDTRGAFINIAHNSVSPFLHDAKHTMFQIGNTAGVHIINPQLGKNGGDAFTNPCMISISGQANGNSVEGGDEIPQGPSASSTTVGICYEGAINANNDTWLRGFNIENCLNYISSDSSTLYVNGLEINGGRFGCSATAELLKLDAATTVTGFRAQNANLSGNLTFPSTAKVKWSSWTGGFFGGKLTVIGNSDVDGSGTASDFSMAGGTMAGTACLGGTFQHLQFRPNMLPALVGGTSIGTGYGSGSSCTDSSLYFSDNAVCKNGARCKDYSLVGTWTPVLCFDSGSCASTGMTATNSGAFRINGDTLEANVNLALSAKGSATGSAKITGLPLPLKNAFGGGMVATYSGLASIIGPILFAPNGATTTVSLYEGNTSTGTSSTPLDQGNFTNSGALNATLLIPIQ